MAYAYACRASCRGEGALYRYRIPHPCGMLAATNTNAAGALTFHAVSTRFPGGSAARSYVRDAAIHIRLRVGNESTAKERV